MQPWADELADVRAQMGILRSLAKRYVWCFSANRCWYAYTPELGEKYGLPEPTFEGAAEAMAGWHAILAEKPGMPADLRVKKLIGEVRRFDQGRLSPAELCGRFGTPGEWMVLGPLTNPLTDPTYAAASAALRPVGMDEVWHGRDGAVHWVPFRCLDPLGRVNLLQPLDWRDTDHASAHCAVDVVVKCEVAGLMGVNWDDGIVVRLNDEVIFDQPTYPERGHGRFYHDRYLFEQKVPVVLPEGRNRLMVTSINQKGMWGFNLRFFDTEGFPLEGVTFELPE